MADNLLDDKMDLLGDDNEDQGGLLLDEISSPLVTKEEKFKFEDE